jgi:hypothetical protein
LPVLKAVRHTARDERDAEHCSAIVAVAKPREFDRDPSTVLSAHRGQ